MNKPFDEEALRARYGQTNPKSVIAKRNDRGHCRRGGKHAKEYGIIVTENALEKEVRPCVKQFHWTSFHIKLKTYYGQVGRT